MKFIAVVMRRSAATIVLLAMLARGVLLASSQRSIQPSMSPAAQRYTLEYDSPVDPFLQGALEALDLRLRQSRGMAAGETAVGVLDLRTLRLAMLGPDQIDYAASLPKIAILFAWFKLRPQAQLDEATRHELGLVIRRSDNALATKYSQQLGLRAIQGALNSDGFYDPAHGGGIWMGKHYGKSEDRLGDPIGNHSHAATVRQLLRFYLRLEQGTLVSPDASRTMREIFSDATIPHIDDKFVRGLAGRPLELRRKAGWWESWIHDTAVVLGEQRHYILVALTRNADRQGESYLQALAAEVDDLLTFGRSSHPQRPLTVSP